MGVIVRNTTNNVGYSPTERKVNVVEIAFYLHPLLFRLRLIHKRRDEDALLVWMALRFGERDLRSRTGASP